MSEVTIKVDLADDTKKLLKAVVESAKSISKAAPASNKSGGSRRAAAEEVEDETNDDAEDESNDEDDESNDDEDDFGGDDGGDDAEPELEQADVQVALRDYANVTDKATAIDLLKKHGGVTALSKLKADKYAKVIAEAKKLTAAAKKKKGK